ncbi:MAG: ABC transporter permease [Lachnospiraceae bacterium]|nr:ABC transporter permease [Lachnospiraceae bacterium]
MRISSFFYTLRQGVRNLFRNKLFTLASIATISACLFLFGLFYAIVTNFQYIVKNAQQGVSVSVFFDDGLADSRIQQIGEMITRRTEVANVVYISADEAWAEFKKDYLKGYEDGFTENPLIDSAHYDIYLSDVSMQQALVTYLVSMEGVRQVNRSELVATTLTGVNALIAYVSVGIIVILLAVSVFLISNTVMIGISVRREEINIMKYIGATDFFVRSPFVIEGMLIGLIGAALPLGVIYGMYNMVLNYVSDRFPMLTTLLSFLTVEEVFGVLTPVSLGIGVGIGFMGSIVTVRRYLRV